ncbi:MAG TPA: site-specific DNA-methyltransferase, partial [Verrucomicrobiae bacterium]|nr:site-specific DNA-methyltransferase [Verrucomicrobiae bacterium]
MYLYQNNCLAVLDAIAAKYPEGRFDMIFADPPYFLSNGGITCHAGKMVSVHKGDWDKSQGPELNHEFNRAWLERCRNVLKPNGTIWVSGTHHVIFSVGFAMQQLGFKILNDIAWEKPNPPPNLSCRYFTHSTETILWAAKSEKSKHVFNYAEMRKVTGKQMKTVWRSGGGMNGLVDERINEKNTDAQSTNPNIHSSNNPTTQDTDALSPIWTMQAPGRAEKEHGKHPTQKPVALVQRCIEASTHKGDWVLDPFLGGGTTAIAALRAGRHFVGIELDAAHVQLAAKRSDREIIEIILRTLRVRVEINVFTQPSIFPSQPSFDLDLFGNAINGSRDMAEKPATRTERIFHETKFVFLSCAQVSEAAVV